jgi:hypothetical protein
MIGERYVKELVNYIMPLITASLQKIGDEQWSERECAIYACQLFANENVIKHVLNLLPDIIQWLVKLSGDPKFFFIRMSTLTVLTRFARWICGPFVVDGLYDWKCWCYS